MTKVRWGILGPGTIAHAFAQGLQEADSAILAAVASRDRGKALQFGKAHAVDPGACYGSYEDLCADPEIDAIYVATPHPFHKPHGLMVLAAGKHLLLEKPAALTAGDVAELVTAAGERDRFFMEAYMYLHHPQIGAALRLLAEEGLGPVRHIRAVFCFDAPFDPASRLYAPALAGGGIYDVGGYTVSAARLFAGAGEGAFPMPQVIRATGLLAPTGVDALAMAHLVFERGVTAELVCGVSCNLGERIEVYCDVGRIVLPAPWIPGKEAAPSDTQILVERAGETRAHAVSAPKMLYAYEAEAASRAILDGLSGLSYPILSGEESIGMAQILDDWHAQVVGPA